MSEKEKNGGAAEPIHSIVYATKILELYASQRKEYMSLTEISRALSLHKTTVYRILRTLQTVGWIDQSPQSSQYRLGTGVLLVAGAVSVHRSRRDMILEEMNRLARELNENVVLSALRGEVGICVDLVRSEHRLSASAEYGYLVPLHVGATGKVLLSAQTPEVIERILNRYPPKTAAELRQSIDRIRREGYCVSDSEVDPGVAAVAVPLLTGDWIYALTVSGPDSRIREQGFEKLRDALLQAKERIETKAGRLAGKTAQSLHEGYPRE